MAKPPEPTGDFTETTVSSRLAYDGGLLKVKRDEVRLPDGAQAWREYVLHPGAVMMLAFVDPETILLERQYRYPKHRHFIELPAGKLEAGEEPLATAKRELAEETGLRGGAWNELAAFWTTPGFCREHMHVYLAEDVEGGEADADPDEQIELVRWPAGEVATRLAEIEDAKTLAGLLLFLRARGSSSPG